MAHIPYLTLLRDWSTPCHQRASGHIPLDIALTVHVSPYTVAPQPQTPGFIASTC